MNHTSNVEPPILYAAWAEAGAFELRRGVEVTLLMPRGPDDPALTAAALADYFAVEGGFRLVQRESRWAGEALVRTLFWLRQVFRDPEVRRADLLYSRIPAMLGMGGRSPLPFAVDHYRPWPDDLPIIRPLLRRTARQDKCLGIVLHSAYAAGAYARVGVPAEKVQVIPYGLEFDRYQVSSPEAPDRLRAYNLTVTNVFNALRSSLETLRAGTRAILETISSISGVSTKAHCKRVISP